MLPLARVSSCVRVQSGSWLTGAVRGAGLVGFGGSAGCGFGGLVTGGGVTGVLTTSAGSGLAGGATGGEATGALATAPAATTGALATATGTSRASDVRPPAATARSAPRDFKKYACACACRSTNTA